MHRLLKRQLKRHLGIDGEVPENLRAFLDAVDETYRHYDDDRDLLERSMELSSMELMQANADLRSVLDDLENRVRERTADLDAANSWLLDEIAERRLVEQRLRESEERLQQAAVQIEDALRKTRHVLDGILESMPSAIIGLDGDGLVTHWNKSAAALSGLSPGEAEGLPVERAFAWLKPRMKEAEPFVRKGESYTATRQSLVRDGKSTILDVMIYPLAAPDMEGTVIRLDDVTERSRMEEIMIHTEKMMTVGGLAAGMAHEINNPLGGILQSAQVVVRRLESGGHVNEKAAEEAGCTLEGVRDFMEKRDVLPMLRAIRESASRATQIVAHMLEFSRKSGSSRRLNDLSMLFDKAVSLSQSDYDLKKVYDFKKIEITREYDPELPQVPCTATQIEQVFVNLLRNSAQALCEMPGGEPHRITLRTAREDGWARLELQDNGPGMTEEVRRHVFEPFFTTKPPGKGTGLGLSVSFFIVTQNHGGEIEVESEPGKGAKFIIRLPLTRKTSQA